jgi:hypothetical protein
MEVDVAVMSPVSNSVIAFIEILCKFFTEINSIEKDIVKVLQPTFCIETSHPYVYELKESVTITCKGAESFFVRFGL